MDLAEIQKWLREKKDTFIVGRYKMFSKSNEKVSYKIIIHGMSVYDSNNEWAVEQKCEALYDGIKVAAKILMKDYLMKEMERVGQETKGGEIMEDVFYFVRRPDHMIECSKYLPKCARIDVIKRRHKIFKTYEEAEKYQAALGVKPLQERQRMNREFQQDGLDEYYGYK